MEVFIKHLIEHIVDKPDEVHINKISGERIVIYELSVGDGDMGKVIGRDGKTATSLRTLLTAVSAKQGKLSVLEILDTNGKNGKKEIHNSKGSLGEAEKRY
jgi:predicted RNA-binding protein YlqC (UPF0109 family)